MPRRSRRRVRRRFRKRTARRGRMQVRGLRRAIRRVILSQTETKILPVLGDAATVQMGGTQTYVFNPQFQPTQGLGSGSRIGRKIENVKMWLSLRYTHQGVTSLLVQAAGNSRLRMLVLRTRAIKTAGVASNALQVNPALMASSDIFRDATGGSHVYSTVDKNKWTVIMDKTFQSALVSDAAGLTPSTGRAHDVVRRKIVIPLPRSVVYRDDALANSFSTGTETYVVFVAGFLNASALDFVGTLEVQGEIRWKDA